MSATNDVSEERIRSFLSAQDVPFADYVDGELAVPTHNAIFLWNTQNPMVLQLKAHWRGVASNDAEFHALAHEVAVCNSSRTSPKAYLAPFEDGSTFGLIAECNVLTAGGLTEAQLSNFHETSMAMILSFFHDLEVAHPEFVTWKDES